MPECEICFHPYSTTRKPLILPCGHTCCSHCLKLQVKSFIVKCAFCLKDFPARFDDFPVNYQLLEELQQPIKNDYSEEIAKLQEDIHELYQIEEKLNHTSTDFETASKTCEEEISFCVKSIIQSIEHAKDQLIQKVQNINQLNQKKISQLKQDIISSIQRHTKLLKVLVDSINSNTNLSSSIIIDLKTLKSTPKINLSLQRTYYDHLGSLMSSYITESLAKNLNLAVEDILIHERIENSVKPKPDSMKDEAWRNYEGDDIANIGRRGRGMRRGTGRGRGRGRTGRFPRGGIELDRFDGSQHDDYDEAKGELDDESVDSNHSVEVFRGRERGNRGNHAMRMGSVDKRHAHANSGVQQNKIIIPPSAYKVFEDRKYRDEVLNFEEPVRQRSNWYIKLGPNLKLLPKFVTKQIDEFYLNDPIIRIFNNGKISNIANTDLMMYYEIDGEGNTLSTHPLVKR